MDVASNTASQVFLIHRETSCGGIHLLSAKLPAHRADHGIAPLMGLTLHVVSWQVDLSPKEETKENNPSMGPSKENTRTLKSHPSQDRDKGRTKQHLEQSNAPFGIKKKITQFKNFIRYYGIQEGNCKTPGLSLKY